MIDTIKFYIYELNMWLQAELKQVASAEWITTSSDLKIRILNTERGIEFLVVGATGELHRDVYYNDVLVFKNVGRGSKSANTLFGLFSPPPPPPKRSQSAVRSRISIPPRLNEVPPPSIARARAVPPVKEATCNPIEQLIIPDNNRKRICFIVSNSCIGGVEKLTLTLLKHITEYHKTIIVTEIKGELHNEYEKYSDVCVFENRKEKLKAFLNNNHFDIYHIFNSMFALELLNEMHGRVILSMFGDYTNPLMWFQIRKEALIKKIENIDVITADNIKNIELLGNFPILVNNGIEIPSKEITKCTSTPIVAWVGRNSGEKRPDALYVTVKSCPDTWFFVAIGNVYTDVASTKTLKNLQNLPNVVVWINANEKQVDFILTHATVILNTSMVEGMPVALLEGMARGCYPIAPNVGSIADLIKNVGTVVEDLSTEDYSKYIRESLIKCNNNPDLVNKIRDCVIEKHDIKNFVGTMNKIYSGDIDVDKTSILNMAERIDMKNCDARLIKFLKEEPWNIRSNLEYGEKLYSGLFDVDLQSVSYWHKIIQNGYERRRFTHDLLKVALEINKDNKAAEEAIRNCKEKLNEQLHEQYDDDNPQYIPGFNIIGVEDRLESFIEAKKWKLENDYEYGKTLFKTLFDSELAQNEYWHDAITDGIYTREMFTRLLFGQVLRLMLNGEYVKKAETIVLENMRNRK